LTISDGNGSNHHQKHSIAGDDIAYNNEKMQKKPLAIATANSKMHSK